MPADHNVVERVMHHDAAVPDCWQPAEFLAGPQKFVHSRPSGHRLEASDQVLIVPTLPQLARAVGLFLRELCRLRAIDRTHPRFLHERKEARIIRAGVAVSRHERRTEPKTAPALKVEIPSEFRQEFLVDALQQILLKEKAENLCL